ncbi:phage tail assembly chaperone G [Rummeliibacillus stabekisii]|uniref:phage tail assembly chaperone G n=1 Tax=Rummeliibacillus stabekisii TaxID=241244 RepID=UPI003718F817
MIKIELFNQETGKTETHTQTFVPARALRQVAEFGMKVEEDYMTELEQMDGMVAVVADIFTSDNVNFDSIYDGVEASKLSSTLEEIIKSVMGGEAKKKQQKENLKKVVKSQ